MLSHQKHIKSYLAFLALLLMSLLTACGEANTTNPSSTNANMAAPEKQIYVSPIGGVSDIKTFDPALASDIRSINAIDMVFTGLVELNDKLQITDQLAASHSVASDGVTWTFKLKNGLTFSDGKPLTSADVAYSIERALKPETKSKTALYYMGLIKDSDKLNAGKISTLVNDSIKLPDDKTIVIITSQKAAYFLYALSYPCSYVVEKSLVEKYGTTFTDHLSEGSGGAGPWTVQSYERNKQIVFVPNQHYYGPKPKLKKVVMPFYSQDDALYKEYQINRVDKASPPSSQIASAKALPDHQYHEVPQLWTYYFALNYLTKPFDNMKIRQAFALAIDKQLLAHNIYKDTVVATNHVVPEGMPGYNPNLKGPAGVSGLSGDRTMAQQLFQQGMKEAGYTLANFPSVTLTVSSDGDSDARNEFQAVQQMWKDALGVNVKINDIDVNKLFDEIDAATNNSKGLQMWGVDWIADYPDPQDWLTLLFDNGSSNNNQNYGQNKGPYAAEQQANQKLMEQADANTDEQSRLQQYMQAEQKLIDDVAWIPRHQVVTNYVLKPCVSGIVDNAQDLIPPDDWGQIYINNSSSCADTSRFK